MGVPHGRYLMGVHLTGVHLTGVHLIMTSRLHLTNGGRFVEI